MNRTAASILAWITAVSVLTACGNTAAPSGTEGPSATVTEDAGQSLIYASNDYTRINPAIDEHGEINALLFDGLTDHDEDNAVIPRLANSWEVDESGTTYTFHLEEGVNWHDGEPFTAEDVKFTIEAIMDPENESENAPNFEDILEITVIDDTTVSFQLIAPNVAFLDYMIIPILPKHLLEGEDFRESDFFRNPVGTGPYRLSDWDYGQSITLTKNEDYFAGPANIETVIFKIIPDDTTKATQMLSGEVNLTQITPKQVSTFEASEETHIYRMTTSDYRGILYNFGNEYWQENRDLIPAISYGIDRQSILDAVLLGMGEVAYSPIQRNEYNDDSVEQYEYNPAKAEALLEAAGCTKDEDGYWTRNGERIGFTINATPGDQVRADMAQIAAQQLRDIGLDVSANVPAGGIDWENQECCIIGWGSPFDADDHTYKIFGTDKGANYSSYSNEEVDRYLTLARRTEDPAERQEAYSAFQNALAADPAYTYFCYIDAIYIADGSIEGINTDTVLGHHGVGIFQNICDWTIAE